MGMKFIQPKALSAASIIYFPPNTRLHLIM